MVQVFDHLGGGNEILGLVKDPGIVGIERVIEGDGVALLSMTESVGPGPEPKSRP
jgi:hypothetical protein